MKDPNKQKDKIEEATVLMSPSEPCCAPCVAMPGSMGVLHAVPQQTSSRHHSHSFSVTICRILPPFPGLLGNAPMFRAALHSPVCHSLVGKGDALKASSRFLLN